MQAGRLVRGIAVVYVRNGMAYSGLIEAESVSSCQI